jgi:hypothetical protein
MRHRPSSETLAAALAIGLFMALAIPSMTWAAGSCSLSVEPNTVRVGETFVITASGFAPNEQAIGFGALDPAGSAALGIPLDATGSLTVKVKARTWMVGTHSVTLLGDLSNCSAEASLTVRPATAAPATDSVLPSARHPRMPLDGRLVLVWIASLAAAWSVLRRRSRAG